MVVPIRCSPVVGASPAAEEEHVCEASMAGTARSAGGKNPSRRGEAERSGGGLDSGELRRIVFVDRFVSSALASVARKKRPLTDSHSCNMLYIFTIFK